MVPKRNDLSRLQPTIMAVREVLMEYFKHSSVHRMTANSNVSMRRVDFSIRGVYRNERVDMELDNVCVVYIGHVPIAEVGSKPARLIFLTTATQRSPQLRSLEYQVKKFATTFLPGVEIKRSGKELYEPK